jgi:hypothetical protein
MRTTHFACWIAHACGGSEAALSDNHTDEEQQPLQSGFPSCELWRWRAAAAAATAAEQL